MFIIITNVFTYTKVFTANIWKMMQTLFIYFCETMFQLQVCTKLFSSPHKSDTNGYS